MIPTDIDLIATNIKNWADETFPKRTPQSMFLKLYHEISEMIDATDSNEVGGEIADVLIMMLDFAACQGVDVATAIYEKMQTNMARTWVQNPLGDYSHVKDAPRLPAKPGSGNGHADVGGQALAHDRNDAHPDSCRAHGQCRAANLGDCAQFPGHALSATRRFAQCDGPRSGGNVHRGHPHPQQTFDWQGSNRPSGSIGTARDVQAAVGGEDGLSPLTD